jgi:chromosome segregation protein
VRLKSLELVGFKSFPDMTRLNFDHGMTVVVGPNGSGKSNISDAIRWVLGEISAKSVRGSKMEDVIFGGTDNRRQLPFAEVSLTIDNSDIEKRIDSDFDEVTVTRRCYRSGESEYMINRRPVRLRDISELFMNTGVGRTGYSIIGQGKIAEIISQRSDERRSIFEEAAGISKYRYKKNEAERKMISVDENLTRLNDILNELTSRLEPLEKESEKARKYLTLYEEKKQADVSICLFDIGIIKKQLSETEDTYNIARHEFEIADDTLNSFETQSERLFDASQENKLEIERLSGRVKGYDAHRQELISSRLILQNDILHIKSQKSQAEADINMKTAARESAKIKDIETRAEYDLQTAALTALEEQLENDGVFLEALCAQRIKIEEQQASNEKQTADKNEEHTSQKVRLSALDNSYENITARRFEIKNELTAYTESAEIIKSRIDQAEASIKNINEKSTEINIKIKQTETAAEALKAEAERLTDEINRITLDISSKKQRADTLRRMEELFEGYAQSVRQVMRASDSGKLSGIYGPVSRLFEVKPRHAIAVETAVGANIQNIVTENEESAKAAIAYLKQNNAGRATFYPLTSIKSSPLNMDTDSLKRYTGYIGVASDLVTCDSRFSEIIGYMLGRTVVFDNLDHATVMAKATGYRVRIVTLDGQLINAGGSFTGGSVKHDSGILTRASEIERLESEIVRSDIEMKAKEEAAAKINVSLTDVSAKINELAGNLAMINTMYQAENTQKQVLLSQYESDKRRLNDLKNEYNELGGRIDINEAGRAAINSDMARTETDIALLETAYNKLETERGSLTKDISIKKDAYNALRLKITAQRKDVEAAERSISFADETLNSIDEQIERVEQLIYGYNENIITAQNKIEETGREIAAFDTDIAELENNLKTLSSEAQRQVESLQGLRSRIREQTHIRENLFSEYNRLETRRSQITSDQDKITAKLWENYELTYSTAAELGYPQLNEQSRRTAMSAQTELRNKLRALGPVNTGVIDEYKEVRTRHEFLNGQLLDLNKSKENLTDIIYKLEYEMRLRFSSIMQDLSRNFKIVFRELFGGGSAELILTDPENILESGIEINIAPPGKIIKSLSLLSGGEQAFVAIALFFAILNVNPTPFCVLDEIEAALDDINVDRFAEYARRYSDKTQFIIITHRRGTMERADTIYGVTMPERGISKVLSLNINEVEQKIGVKL